MSAGGRGAGRGSPGPLPAVLRLRLDVLERLLLRPAAAARLPPPHHGGVSDPDGTGGEIWPNLATPASRNQISFIDVMHIIGKGTLFITHFSYTRQKVHHIETLAYNKIK